MMICFCYSEFDDGKRNRNEMSDVHIFLLNVKFFVGLKNLSRINFQSLDDEEEEEEENAPLLDSTGT